MNLVCSKVFSVTKGVSFVILKLESCGFLGRCLLSYVTFIVYMYNLLDYKENLDHKAKHQRIDAFELWCWRRLLRVPWTARKSYQSILKKISAEYSLEGLMLKLKLQNFGQLMQRTDSLGKTLVLGKIVGSRRRGRQRMRWLDGITN